MTKVLPSSNAPAVRFSGQRLRELREARGLDIAVMAKRLTLSTAQLQQLEQDQSSLFYSEAIRLAAARKVADFLGEPLQMMEPVVAEAIDPPAVLAELSPSIAPAVEVAAARPEPSTAVLSAGSEGGRLHRTHRGPMRFALSGWSTALSAVVLMFILLLAMQNFSSDELAVARPAAQAPTLEIEKVPSGAPEVAAQVSDAKLATAVSFAVPGETALAGATSAPALPLAPALPAAAVPVLAAASPAEPDCDLSPGSVGSFTPPRPVKDAGQIFVRGVQGQLVCVRDGKGQVWRHQFNNGSGRSFSGTAPWVVESAQLMDMEVYFQGARARASQPGTTRLKLIPGQPG